MGNENSNVVVQLFGDSEEVKKHLLNKLEGLGSSIRFEDDKWLCDKKMKDSGEIISDYTIYFSNIPSKYKTIFKYYILIRLGKVSVRTFVASISYYNQMFEFLEKHCGYPDLVDVDKKMIKDFELYLKDLKLAKSTKEGVWYNSKLFFKSLVGWQGVPKNNLFGAINPFKRKKSDYNIDEKYIPEYVTKQTDILFKDKLIPLHYRLVYWLSRAIPSRVTEITSMKINCLKPSYDNKLVLFIPTWKQNGGHIQPEIRSIFLNPDGEFEKFLISLIKEQMEVASELQGSIRKKGYLFTYRHSREMNGEKAFLILNRNTVEDYFTEVCIENNIHDESGNQYSITPHQLRHNGITDRIEAGFSFIEIRDMTNHKGNSMIWKAYYHPHKEISIKRQLEIEKIRKGNHEIEKPVYFKGRILNLDSKTEERILNNPRAYKIMEGEDSIGICSDITGCKSKMFECLDCDYFIPDADDLDYFKQQIKIWEKKVSLFSGRKQALENAQYNLKLHKSIVSRIENQLRILSGGEVS